MRVTNSGSVRVDLVGGTLDLEPINLIIPNVVTLNVATGLKAQVDVEKIDFDGIHIESLDYEKSYEYKYSELTDQNIFDSDYFKEMSFVIQILALFNIRRGLKVLLRSGAPAGSGLGGSSAMGVTLYKALDKLKNQSTSLHETVSKVKGVESRILNQGVPGYQDYYPALTGGVLALSGRPGGIEFEQLFSPELKEFLESHITLVFSGISRNSGINNWDVYKKFFDKDDLVNSSLRKIADISNQTYQAIKNKEFNLILDLIGLEGESRKTLSPNIVPEQVSSFFDSLKEKNLAFGLKMCGAGGGGCFILTHSKENKSLIEQAVNEEGFQILDFHIEEPLV